MLVVLNRVLVEDHLDIVSLACITVYVRNAIDHEYSRSHILQCKGFFSFFLLYICLSHSLFILLLSISLLTASFSPYLYSRTITVKFIIHLTNISSTLNLHNINIQSLVLIVVLSLSSSLMLFGGPFFFFIVDNFTTTNTSKSEQQQHHRHHYIER